LRDYREPLTTILKTFIYDPLVEWKAPANIKSTESGETVSAKVLNLEYNDQSYKNSKINEVETDFYQIKYLYAVNKEFFI
jgi:hypothetical protein